MVVIHAIQHRDTAELAQYLNDQRPHPPRTFIPDLIQGAQVKPCTGWQDLQKPPPEGGWWANRQNCHCPPCYYYHLINQINTSKLPFPVAVPLAQLINVGLIRLNFNHSGHATVFTATDKDYALSLHRDICYGINSGQFPLQLLEILLVASRKAVLKPLDPEDPEYHHKEFEVYLKRAIQRCKIEDGGQEDGIEQAQEGAKAEPWESVVDLSAEDQKRSSGGAIDMDTAQTTLLWVAPAAQQSQP